MGTAFETVDCFETQIIRAKYNKRKESVSLENTNHVERYLVYIATNKITVICKFCDGVFGL